MTPKAGDRITLGGTVGRVWPDGWTEVHLDGDGDKMNRISPESVAHAKIEARPLQVGDRVTRRNYTGRMEIVFCDLSRAALVYNGHLLDETAPLPDLTRIPDQSSDDEGGQS